MAGILDTLSQSDRERLAASIEAALIDGPAKSADNDVRPATQIAVVRRVFQTAKIPLPSPELPG
jgi:hypothetical protein